MLKGRNILITGGAGSVGRVLISHFLSQDSEVVRILDNNEPGLSSLKRRFGEERCRYLLGDVRDKERLHLAMEDIDVVVHAAALKHVDMAEYNPFEAVKTNILGLQNVVDVAIAEDVGHVVFTSSDKAVAPANTMGTTKLLGERLVTAGNKYRGPSRTRLASVRFGNVINSSQSVIRLFEEQIANGGPVTLTDRRMTRFFLSFDNVKDLISRALEATEGGEIFIHKMPAVRIEDLAETMIENLAPTYGQDPLDVDIEVVGKRVGETLHEETMTRHEAERALENDRLYVVPPETSGENRHLEFEGPEGFSAVDDPVRSSERANKLSRDEIGELLERNGVGN